MKNPLKQKDDWVDELVGEISDLGDRIADCTFRVIALEREIMEMKRLDGPYGGKSNPVDITTRIYE